MSVCDHSSSTSLDCSQIVLIPSFIPSFYNLKALTPHHILYCMNQWEFKQNLQVSISFFTGTCGNTLSPWKCCCQCENAIIAGTPCSWRMVWQTAMLRSTTSAAGDYGILGCGLAGGGWRDEAIGGGWVGGQHWKSRIVMMVWAGGLCVFLCTIREGGLSETPLGQS